CRCRRADKLRSELVRCMAPARGLHRPHPQRREACRFAGSAANQVRVGHQLADGNNVGPRSTTDLTRPRRRGDRVKRREFITVLGGAAVLPLAASAQQSGQMRQIGVLMSFAESDSQGQSFAGALREGLEKLGWNDGRNVRIDIRWSASDAERLRAYAVDLVGSKPDVIVAGATSALARLTEATQTIPIVFAQVSDPIGGGFVPSLARPGGNITGFALYEYAIVAKWLELLKQLAPSINRVAALYDPNDPTNRGQLPEIESRAPAFEVQSSVFPVRNAAEIGDAIDTFA